MTLTNIRDGRTSVIPNHYPSSYELAKALANDILTHISHYRLRGRCVIKVTSTHIKQLLRRLGYDDKKIPKTAIGGYTAAVFTYLDHILEKHGFTLVEKRITKYNTSRYYTLPNCSENNQTK